MVFEQDEKLSHHVFVKIYLLLIIRDHNTLFLKRCTVIENNSKLPYEFLPKTSEHLSESYFIVEGIAKIINKLNLEKVDGHGLISSRMLKLCGN